MVGDGKLIRCVKDNLKYHLADSTSLQVMSTPIAAAYETLLAGMSNENSINARALGFGLAYAGLGRIYSKGLDLSRSFFKIKPETRERIKQLHDTGYATAYCLLMSPPFYYAAGVRDTRQIAIGTAASMGLGLVMGGPAGWAIDIFRDFTGLKKSERLPKYIQGQNKNVKKGLAALLIAGTLALTASVYSLNSAVHSTNQVEQKENSR